MKKETSDNLDAGWFTYNPEALIIWRPGYQLLQAARSRSELHREHWQCAWGSTRQSHPGQTIGPGLGDGGGVVDVIAAATGAGLVAGVVVCVAPTPEAITKPATKMNAIAPRMPFFTRTPIIWGPQGFKPSGYYW
jgi:hypothetical protein